MSTRNSALSLLLSQALQFKCPVRVLPPAGETGLRQTLFYHTGIFMGWTFFSPREKLQSLQSGVGIQHTDTKVFWTWHSLTFGQGNINIEDCPLSIVKSKPSIILRIFIYLRGPSGQLRLKCSSDTSGVQLTGHFIDTAPSPPSQQENLVKFKYFPNSIVQKRLDIMENNKTTRELENWELALRSLPLAPCRMDWML